MKNGAYQYAIQLRAPIGPRPGTLELLIDGEQVEGTLTLFRKQTQLKDGSLRSQLLRFSGEMQTFFYPLPFTAEGQVDEAALQMRFHTKKGDFSVKGVAVGTAETESEE